ncbi:sensor domain-containing protein [Leifsonia aquatica]|uniref:sensor domain-containing protein n=1 Tax=Leifsonia aquatica TaxID=144185 RepID=UPI000468559F|nr:sensor domain-containing diguanylate cyclase [Leifsonia aquatica]
MTADDPAALYDAAPCGLLTTDADGRITHSNAALSAWTGYSQDALTGRLFAELLDPGSRIFYETRQLPTLRLEGAVHEVALTVVTADGTRMPALMNSTTVTDAGGAIERIDIAVFDASRREDWERQLLTARRAAEESEERTRMLQEASAAFVGCETEQQLAETLAESVRRAFSAASAAVHLAGGDGFLLAGGTEPIDLHALLATRTLDERLLLLRTDEEEDAALAVALDEARVAELTIIPLMDGDAVIGAVTCSFGRARGVDGIQADLSYALVRQAAQVLRRIRLQAQLEAYALHDPLTGLANRTLLRSRLAEALATATAERTPIAMIFVDLDGFKEINDLFDHSTGDAVLREVASRLNGTIRQADLVGRFGGDEFLIVCEGIDEEAATVIAERAREAVRRPLAGIADERSISASIGVAVYRPAGREPLSTAEIFRFADTAMYQSKDSGKDRISVLTI